MKLSFYGAAETVTGSKYLVEDSTHRFLVDCGLFQGLKELRLRNWQPFPIDPKTIDALLLTHAHLDHSGYLPLLIKQGFKGPIYSSKATRDLCEILLLDSGRLQEEDAYRANRLHYSKHHPALALYTEQEAKNCFTYFQPVPFDKEHSLAGGSTFKLTHSGHILGSSFITLKNQQATVVFSGDIGRPNDPVMKPPEKIAFADYLILESTYGNRVHPKTDPAVHLAEIINSTVKKGGSVIIPSFAVGRAQTVLYYIDKLKDNKQIPADIPVYLDSPMAQDATSLWCRYEYEHSLSNDASSHVCSTARYVRSVDESKKLNESKTPCIIISASGMAEGGRVLHHIKHFAPFSANTILFVGYQAEGTRGNRMLKGEKEIKIHGEMVPIKAHIDNLESLSSHADYEELILWLKEFKAAPKAVFLTHGETDASIFLKQQIEQRLKWKVIIPKFLESFEL